jgi:O-antigen/teichoic acid export membrane protein
MRYNPLSFTLGLYAAFLSLASEALILLVLGWVRFYREDEQDHPLRRIAKNSITPMFAQLAGKVIDFGFAFISLRLLGPEGNGRYTFAVTTWLFFNTLADFGLETLVTREVARDRSYANSNRYFSTMLVMRLAFTTLSLPGAMLWMGLFGLSGEVTGDVVLATALLMVGMAPSAVSATMSAVFRGHEKFEYLAAMQIMASIIKVPLGLGALLIGWGVAGLAGSSIAVNLVTMASLWSIFTRAVIKPDIRKGFERLLVRPMLVSAFPLMLNGFLIGLMFKSDVFLLYPFRGDIEVGLYNSAYKFIDALLIFPSAITMALFPLFSSYSSNSRENMMRAYSEGLRLLSILSLPISAGTLFIAYDIIGLAFGDKFLPGGAIALQILIWFLPFSYINGVTQYVLIAIDRQRFITWAVIITATCNIALNLALIPFFGYIAASALTIVTEVILLVIYAYLMKREIAPIPFWHTLARPGAATLLMIGVLLVLNPVLGINNFFVTVIAGTLVYLGGLALFKAITAEDISYVRKILRR